MVHRMIGSLFILGNMRVAIWKICDRNNVPFFKCDGRKMNVGNWNRKTGILTNWPHNNGNWKSGFTINILNVSFLLGKLEKGKKKWTTYLVDGFDRCELN